jgi:hypothetical protein
LGIKKSKVFATEKKSSLKRDNIKSARSIRSQKGRKVKTERKRGKSSAVLREKNNHLSQKKRKMGQVISDRVYHLSQKKRAKRKT